MRHTKGPGLTNGEPLPKGTHSVKTMASTPVSRVLGFHLIFFLQCCGWTSALWHAGCLSCFFHCPEELPEKKQLTGGTIYCCSWFMAWTSSYSQSEGASSWWIRKQRKRSTSGMLLPVFVLSMAWSTHTHCRPSPLSSCSPESPSQALLSWECLSPMKSDQHTRQVLYTELYAQLSFYFWFWNRVRLSLERGLEFVVLLLQSPG